jgi:hypothetical protein
VTWLPPELEVGEEPELRPPELELEPELVELDPEEPELVPEEPELAEDEFGEPVEVELDPVEDAVLCVDPGRVRASAPAVTTPATATVAVVDRTMFLPRSLAAMAWRIPSSRRALLMYLILWSRTRKFLHEPSGSAMSRAALPALAPEASQAT